MDAALQLVSKDTHSYFHTGTHTHTGVLAPPLAVCRVVDAALQLVSKDTHS